MKSLHRYPGYHGRGGVYRRRSWARISFAAMFALSLIFGGILAAIVWISPSRTCTGACIYLPPSSTAPTRAPRADEAIVGVDLGAGTPGAPCASNRAGKWFEFEGKRYVCRGPAPYTWRRP